MAETGIFSTWMDKAHAPLERANSLLSALTFEQEIQLAVAPASEHGKNLLGSFHIPDLVFMDGPNGVRGETGVTAFPAAIALAATFNRALAKDFGSAVGEEVRNKGGNTWLGPAVDIARTPLAGRQSEALGEDPFLASQICAAEVQGAKSKHVISMLKHFIANNQEYFRTGYAGKPHFGPHSPAINVIITEKALQEIYYPPIKAAIQSGGADSVMMSYNRLNGLPTCENPHILETLRQQWNFSGFTAPDFAFAVRDPLAAVQAGIDLPALSEREPAGRTVEMFTSGQVSLDRLDDICRRILFAKFDAGLFDNPKDPAEDDVSSPTHINLARQIAEESMVLLRNEKSILPLPTGRGISIAVIGTAGEDAQWTIGGSAAVTLTTERLLTPLAGITARLSPGDKIRFSQGSMGDVPLPSIPGDMLSPSAGSGAGLLGEYWDNPELRGDPVLVRIEPQLKGMTKPGEINIYPWSARWTGTFHPLETGLYRFSLLTAGIAKLYFNDQLVASGYREATRFLSGPLLPIQCSINLTAGVEVPICIEYCSGAALFGEEMTLGWLPPSASQIPDAVEAARQVDVAIVFASTATGEGMDRSSLLLPGDQDALITAVARANSHTIVILNTSGPVLMPWLENVAGVVQVWYPGEQFGAALAAVLFGDTDPGGRLPITFPADERQGPAPISQPEHYPGVDGIVHYDEGIFVGYRWYDQLKQEPLFPFGFGLSYASFAYSQIEVQNDRENGIVNISVMIQNTSKRAGSEVVQLYVSMPEICAEPPVQLKGFEKVWLEAGESKALNFILSRRALSIYDPSTGNWQFYPGSYCIHLGSSSRHLHLFEWLECD